MNCLVAYQPLTFFSLALVLIHSMYSNYLKHLGYKNNVDLPAFCDHGMMAGEELQRPSTPTALFCIQEIQATKGNLACLSHVAQMGGKVRDKQLWSPDFTSSVLTLFGEGLILWIPLWILGSSQARSKCPAT